MYYIDNGYVRNTEDELMHHGIKGQKWGVRKDTRSYKQKKYDERMYGKRGSKRIGKRIEKGEGIRSARHVEVKKNPKKEARKKVLIGEAQIIGGGVASLAGAMASLGGVNIVNLTRRTGGKIPLEVNNFLNSSAGAILMGAGVGTMGKGVANVMNNAYKAI